MLKFIVRRSAQGVSQDRWLGNEQKVCCKRFATKLCCNYTESKGAVSRELPQDIWPGYVQREPALQRLQLPWQLPHPRVPESLSFRPAMDPCSHIHTSILCTHILCFSRPGISVIHPSGPLFTQSCFCTHTIECVYECASREEKNVSKGKSWEA